MFNTPSHHRVHHGRNPRYIDRNHAGSLLIWDRMFGTFVEETDEPVYGVVKPLKSANPLWANFAGWADLWSVARSTRALRDRLRVLFEAPGWRPAEQGGPVRPPEVSWPKDEPANAPTPRGLAIYVFLQFVLLLVLTAAALARAQALGTTVFAALALVVVVVLVVLSALLEQRPWARAAEAARVLAVIGLAAVFGGNVVGILLGRGLLGP